MNEAFNDKYEKKNPFRTPEGYFKNFEEDMIRKIKAEKVVPEKRKISTLLMPYIAIAAIVATIWFVIPMIFPLFVENDDRMLESHVQKKTSPREINLDQDFNPTREDILEYLSSELDDYDLLYAELL